METGRNRFGLRRHVYILHPSRRRTGPAPRDQLINALGGTGRHGLYAPVATVAHPAIEAELVCLVNGPAAEPDALHAPGDAQSDRAPFHAANMRRRTGRFNVMA